MIRVDVIGKEGRILYTTNGLNCTFLRPAALFFGRSTANPLRLSWKLINWAHSIDLRNSYAITSRLSAGCIDDALISTFDNALKEMNYVALLLFTFAVAKSWPSSRVEREAEMDGKMEGNEWLVVTW